MRTYRKLTPRGETAECRRCSSTFSYIRSTGSRRKYCSVACRTAFGISNRIPKEFSETLRTRTCQVCSSEFSYPIGRGSDRKLCSDLCRNARRHANSKTKPLCVVEGCKNPRGYSDGTCNSCYYRRRRTGTLDRPVYSHRTLATSGYILLSNQHGHPLANKHGSLYEHRKCLYDSIGPGQHRCHWCSGSISWIKGKCLRGSLVPDHLDGDKTNNDVKNLVPACNKCNCLRGLFMAWVMHHRDDPFLWEMYEKARHKGGNGYLASTTNEQARSIFKDGWDCPSGPDGIAGPEGERDDH